MSRAETSPAKAPPGEPKLVPISMLVPSALNPRKRFDDAGLDELAASIRTRGVLQPLVVRTHAQGFEIVAGERRFLAAQRAGLTQIPVVVHEMDDAAALEVAMVENVLRENLAPLEEADGFAALRRHGWTQEQIAHRVGKSRAYVGNRLAIADAGDAARGALEEGRISASVALVLARAPEAQRVEALAQMDRREGYSVHDAMDVVRATSRRLDEAPFDVADESLCPASGACGDCPRRSGAEASLFAVGDDYCLDGDCWKRKCGVAFVQRAATHKGPVLTAEKAAAVLTDWGVEYGSGYTDRGDELRRLAGNPRSLAALEKLPVTIAQRASTGALVELLPAKDVDRILRKSVERPAEKAAPAPKQSEAQKAAEAERKRCEAASAALVAAAIADRRNAAVRLIGIGSSAYGAAISDYGPTALAVAGATKQTALGAWARKCSKDDLAAFLLAARLDGEYCAHADAVRALAARLDLPVPEGFAEAPKAKAKAGKRGAK